MPDRMVVSTYVPPLKRVTPLKNTMASDIEDVLKLIRRWSPFNQEDSLVVGMCNLYPDYFQIPVAASSDQYFDPLPLYINKEDI